MALILQVTSVATPDSTEVSTSPAAAGEAVADTLLPVDTAFADTLVVDTVTPDTILYLMLDAPAAPEFPSHDPVEEDTTGMSWILTALLALFVVVAVRFRSNSKYLSAMFRDAVEVRERGNAFDETVREKSFMIMLNVLWCISVGVLLYTLVEWSFGQESVRERLTEAGFPGIPPSGFPADEAPLGMGLCICLTCVWQILMVMAYTIVGNVFNDATHTKMWVTGYLAVTGLSTLIFFPLALMAVCYSDKIPAILAVGLSGYIVAKLIFIWKGFRIFFRQIASWLLFLYYLCSLEIVPLILLYGSTLLVCATIL
ncbi:MAG: DUF4271 domain-containing protein [Muribaculaceae bacterium]|nr:DUF4271 domain-containing protein [Muribaculaceae bacterium]